jgi:hypothetical protein
MPKKLAETLIEMRKSAMLHGGHVPSAKDLSEKMGITLDNARRRIYLIEHDPHYRYFRKKGRIRLLDEGSLVTEELTAWILLYLTERLREQGKDLARKDEFAEYVVRRLSSEQGEEISKDTVLQIIEQAIRRDYIRTPFGREDVIRLGPRARYEEDYLDGVRSPT